MNKATIDKLRRIAWELKNTKARCKSHRVEVEIGAQIKEINDLIKELEKEDRQERINETLERGERHVSKVR